MKPPAPELSYEDLRFEFDLPDEPPAKSVSKVVIGQPRALRALELGTAIDGAGYNIFVSGPPGTGRQTAVKKILDGLPPSHLVRDLIYVNNFPRPDAPTIVALPQGKAESFKARMVELIETLKVRLRQELASEAYKGPRDQLLKKTEFQENRKVSELEAKLAASGFKMAPVGEEGDDSGAMDIVPVIDGEPVDFDALQERVAKGELPQETWNQVREQYYSHIDEMRSLFDALRDARSQMEKDLSKLRANTVRPVIRRQVRSIGRAFPYVALKVWLASLEKDVESNLSLFLAEPNADEGPTAPSLSRYGVNVLVEHGSSPKLPVVFENRPTPAHLFGTVDVRTDPNGESRSNFLMIKPGSLHLASGGYLVLRAEDILNQEETWPLLKRTLQNGLVEIPSASGPFGGSAHLKPQAAEIRVKVIMVGPAGLYDLLVQEDPEFARLFKISAEFDPVMDLNPSTVNEYLIFMDNHLRKHGLPAIDNSGRQEVLEYGVRLAEHRRRLSTEFSRIADLLMESAYWARKLELTTIDRRAVVRALEERRYLFSLPEEKMDEQVAEGQILLSVAGTAVGQVNGLAVLDRGSSSFGRPMRITAVAGPGDEGIVNIEGEAGLSGEIHDKGVLILQGLIRSRFARNFPLTLSASVGFEQSYGGIDGDSASSTEAYALLSAIAEIPLRQDLAVSGSVNQRGEIQPVGGITEKVEGFYYTCRKMGLTGTQGVIIPRSNIQNLVLAQEVQEAVRDGRFHLYPVTTIDEGFALLSSHEMGTMNSKGQYPSQSLGALIVKKLERLREAAQSKDD